MFASVSRGLSRSRRDVDYGIVSMHSEDGATNLGKNNNAIARVLSKHSFQVKEDISEFGAVFVNVR